MAETRPIISILLDGRHLWMSFLVVENSVNYDQFILGRKFSRKFSRNFSVPIDLNDVLKDPERKEEKKPVNHDK